ncbi:MAG: lipopolysaccharide export system permease protein [Fimbriimonadaceae bacterium]|nr:lipopolysaccharide export system permease protein [Fimbriimonadaceae bacterium]
MVKKLDTYVVRELIVPFLIGTIAVALMFSINQLMAIMKEISLQNVPREAILLSLIYKLPYWLNMTLPVGVSLAASLAFTRFTRESELTAMRAAGTPIVRVVLPVAAFGIVVGIFNYFLVEGVMPRSEKKFTEVARKVGLLGVMPEFRSNAVIYLKDYTATFGSVVRSTGEVLQLNDVALIQRPSPDETWIYTADTGTYKDGIWTLHKPYGWNLKGLDLIGVRPRNKGDMIIDQRIIIDDLLNPRSEQTQTAGELREAINNGRKTGLDTRILEVAYYTRFAVPASCVIFAFVAPIFAILFARTGGFAGVLLSIFLVMAYYNAFIASTEIFGRNGWVPPLAAAWIPNLIFAFLGLIALRRLE